MRLLSLLKGFPGHRLRPPMTDGPIGAYTAATVGGSILYVHGMRVLGLPEEPAASAILPGRKGEE